MNRSHLALVALPLAGCPDPAGDTAVEAPAAFSFMVISDPQVSGSGVQEGLLQGITQAAEHADDLAFVAITGDLVTGGLDEAAAQYEALDASLSELEVPVYPVMGELDYGLEPGGTISAAQLEQAESLWTSATGLPASYSFMIEGWHFLALNSVRGLADGRFFDPEQLDWLEVELSGREPAVAFWHHPLQTDDTTMDWSGDGALITPEVEPELYGLLQDSQRQLQGIFVGHGERWLEDTLEGSIPVREVGPLGSSAASPTRDFYLVSIADEQISSVTQGLD